MKRKLIITIEDEFTNQKISGTCSLNEVNNLYVTHKVNGINQLLFSLNEELNTLLSQKFVISLPNELK